jgi:HK97 family phage major capsid protein
MKPNDYSLTAVLRAALAGTWATFRSDERREHDRLSEIADPLPPSQRTLIRVPGHALRDLSVATPSAGGYLTDQGQGEYVPSLTGDSTVLRLGVTSFPVPRGASSLAWARGTAGATAHWLGDEATAVTPSQPTLGQINSTGKTMGLITTASRALLIGAANAEAVIRAELRLAAAAALDAAVLAGSGINGQPLGIVGTPGVGAFTGGSLDQAALRNAQADIGTANAVINPAAVAYVAPPAVAELLAKRQRFTGSDRGLWEGSSFDGVVEGCRAVSTSGAPVSTLVLGDWSNVQIAEWAGGIILEVDPFSSFSTGAVSVRVLLTCDVVVQRPAAFSVATGVS